MKEVLAHIEKKKQEFARLPLFEYMRDTSIDPRQRLAWVPYVTPLAMGFGDLWKYVLRREPTTDAIQKMINKHTREDENHWKWFPQDIKALGFYESFDFSDSIEFIWSKDTEKARLLCMQIAMLTNNVESQVLLAAIESVEATANIAFSTTAQVANELKQITCKNYHYFGDVHLIEDSTHSTFEKENRKFIESIDLTEKQKTECFEIVDKLFYLFSECLNEIINNTFESNLSGNTQKELTAY
ncbi:MAG: hypothetical protein WBF90_08505 [Rivularia sp. (in: cyanobacteria)]|jgi:hypothetical protein